MKFLRLLFSIIKWIAWFFLSLIIAITINWIFTGGNSEARLTVIVGLWILILLPSVVMKIRKIKKQILR